MNNSHNFIVNFFLSKSFTNTFLKNVLHTILRAVTFITSCYLNFACWYLLVLAFLLFNPLFLMVYRLPGFSSATCLFSPTAKYRTIYNCFYKLINFSFFNIFWISRPQRVINRATAHFFNAFCEITIQILPDLRSILVPEIPARVAIEYTCGHLYMYALKGNPVEILTSGRGMTAPPPVLSPSSIFPPLCLPALSLPEGKIGALLFSRVFQESRKS